MIGNATQITRHCFLFGYHIPASIESAIVGRVEVRAAEIELRCIRLQACDGRGFDSESLFAIRAVDNLLPVKNNI